MPIQLDPAESIVTVPPQGPRVMLWIDCLPRSASTISSNLSSLTSVSRSRNFLKSFTLSISSALSSSTPTGSNAGSRAVPPRYFPGTFSGYHPWYFLPGTPRLHLFAHALSAKFRRYSSPRWRDSSRSIGACCLH